MKQKATGLSVLSRENLPLLFAVVVVLLTAIFSYRTWDTLDRREAQLELAQQIATQTNAILSCLKDAETGQRGFLLTGEDRYLDPYRQAVADVPVLLKSLEAVIRQRPDQAQRFEKLKPLIKDKLEELEQTIELRRSKGIESALAVVRTDRGKAEMDQLRGICVEMQTVANRRLAQYSEQARFSANSLGLIATLGSASLLVFLIAAMITIQRGIERRQQHWLHAIEIDKKNRELLTTFVRHLPAAVAMLDRELRYVQVSDRWCADYRLDCSEMLGRMHYEIFPDIPERWKELHRRCLAGETLRAEEDLFQRADGRRTWLRWEIRPWGNHEGRPEGILIFSEDITHLKEAELTKEKRMEDLLHQREWELSTLSDNAQDVIVRFDRDLRYTYVNARVEKETGLPQETMLGKMPSELRLPEPVVDIVTRSVRRVFETGQPNVAELSYPSPGGVTDWEASFSPEFGKSGAVQSVLNIARDITEKKRLAKVAQSYVREIQALAASLMTAQEEERRRVSRELHDQICQQLASLAFDIGGLMTSPLPPKNAQAQLKAIQARIVKASEEARHLAYQLHPSVLDDLGLAASLQDLCRQFSEQNPDIAFDLEDGDLPASASVPREVASCIYRVAQESLQNIAKHSSAENVSFAFGLEKGAVVLTIADDGAGFDPKTVKGSGGLGLIGMEERLRLVKGKLTITARPGHGTRIAVEVPLPSGNLAIKQGLI